MTLSDLGMLDGISATGVVFSGIIIGLIYLRRGIKIKSKPLKLLAFATIFAGLMYLGVFLDFLWVLSTTVNMDNTVGQVGLLSYIWFAPVMVCAIWFGVEIEKPVKPIFVVSIILVIGIIFEIVVFIDPNSFYFDTVTDGSRLTDYNINMASPAGFLMIGLLGPILGFMGVGAMMTMKKSSGVLKKKFLLGFAGILCFAITGFLEGLTQLGALVILVRVGYISSFLLMYVALT
jgi:hypothetical protein